MSFNTNRWRSPLGGKLDYDGTTLVVKDDLLFSADATHDIGASGASRPADIYLSGTLTAGAALAAGGNITTTSGTLQATSGGATGLLNPSSGLGGAIGSSTVVYSTSTARPVGMYSVRTNGAGNVSCFAMANIDATPAATHVVWGAYYDKGSAAYILALGAEGEGDVTVNGRIDGQKAQLMSLSEETTIAAAATTDTTIQIPADAIVYAVSVRVTTAIPTAATFDVGVAGATTRYGTGLAVAVNTTNPGTDDAMRYYAAAAAIRITPDLTPGDTTGRVRVTIHYIAVTPPTA